VGAGLEPAAGEELSSVFGLAPRPAGRGGVRCAATPETAAAVVLGTLTASRVSAIIADSLPATPDALFEAAARIDWRGWLPPRDSWSVRVVGSSAALRSPRYAAQLVKDAVVSSCRSAGRACPPFDPRRPATLIELRIFGRTAQVGLDLGGGSLHPRGAAREAEAPLREDLAAGLAYLAGVRERGCLLDPFAGSGTLLAEAAAVALGRPLARDPAGLAFPLLPLFREVDLNAVRERLRETGSREAPGAILGFDRNERAVRNARELIARRGLAGLVEIRPGRASEIVLDGLGGEGTVLTNPPWGRRLREDPAVAWRELGELARRLPGWTVAALSGDPGLTRHLGLRAARRFPLLVGGVEARLCLYPMRARPPR
jgi:23S rRNA G2445 N2-methylase RlmL